MSIAVSTHKENKMKWLMLLIISGLLTGLAFAQSNRWDIDVKPSPFQMPNPYGQALPNPYTPPQDIEMRKQYDYDPANKFRGTIENDGYTRMRDLNGNILRGNIDNDGYGRLRDQDGNTYRVRPK